MECFTNEQRTDMHLMYGLSGGNSRNAQNLYRKRFGKFPFPEHSQFLLDNNNLQKWGRFDFTLNVRHIVVNVPIADYPCTVKTNMHYVYGAVERDIDLAREGYRQIFPGRNLPDREAFLLLDELLREYGAFHPLIYVGNTTGGGSSNSNVSNI